MEEQFSLFRFVVEMEFHKRLKECKWYQFAKRKEVYAWREKQLKKCKG